jgi:pyruvate-formate lyase
LRHAAEYRMESAAAGFVMVSMLYDDCISRARSVVDGGARLRGSVIESFAITNTADSLSAIRELVYERRLISLERLVQALDADWQGFEREHRLVAEAAKFGNDDAAADRMANLVSSHLAKYTASCAAEAGLDYALIVNINNHMNVGLGKLTAASADGRRSGAPLANGMTPTAGNDRSGVTALLNSLSSIDPTVHAGYVHNLKFDRRFFGSDRARLEALLQGYFAQGGTQAMITVVSRGDLEQAMEHPEQYRNLFVRVGGFSARFVDLPKETQADLVRRTLY